MTNQNTRYGDEAKMTAPEFTQEQTIVEKKEIHEPIVNTYLFLSQGDNT